MSQLTCKDNDGNEVIYGLDPAYGWFYQTYDKQGNLLEDLDTLIMGLTKGQLVDRLEKTDAPERVKLYIGMDLDPIYAGEGGIE